MTLPGTRAARTHLRSRTHNGFRLWEPPCSPRCLTGTGGILLGPSTLDAKATSFSGSGATRISLGSISHGNSSRIPMHSFRRAARSPAPRGTFRDHPKRRVAPARVGPTTQG